MKKYIIFCADIHPIGGVQNYVAGKTSWLEKEGWGVYVFFWGKSSGHCAVSSLDKYLPGGILELGTQPSEWTMRIREKVLNRIISDIHFQEGNEDSILIESQDEIFSFWGELLAERIHAKNMCFICNERFREPNRHYADHMEFFDFKHRRRELACICQTAIVNLFEGYKEVPPEEQYAFKAANMGPVQDVENQAVSDLKKKDWNICYLGRAEKPYVPFIIEGISKFSQKYADHSIQVIFVGNADSRREIIENKLTVLKNVTVSFMGDMVPIPRSLFEKIDVMVAGSGCAMCSAQEGVPTIVADAENYRANGILGYTTFDNILHEEGAEQFQYEDLLEQILVEGVHKHLEFHMDPVVPAEVRYREHLAFAAQSDQKMEYDSEGALRGTVNYQKVLKYYIHQYFPFAETMYRRIKRWGRARK